MRYPPVVHNLLSKDHATDVNRRITQTAGAWNSEISLAIRSFRRLPLAQVLALTEPLPERGMAELGGA